MATAEKRTLSIEAKLKDLLSRPLTTMERNLVRFGVKSQQAFKSLVGSVFSLKGQITGLIGAYVGLRGIAFVRQFGEQADALVKLARSTGDMVENLSELQSAMELSGIKADAFETTIRGLENAAKQATNGNIQFIKDFADLGVTIDDLRSKGPSEIFEQLSKGLERFSGEQDRALKLAQLLPKSYLQLLPLLGQGAEAFRKTITDARAAGATITEAEAKAAEQLNDAFTKVNLAIASVGRAIIVTFGPDATAALETLTTKIVENKDAIASIVKAIGTGIVKAVNLAIDAIINLVGVIESIPGVNLLGGDLSRQRAELEREIFQTRNMILQGLDFSGEMKKRLAAAEQAAVDIEAKLSRGLSGALRDEKAKILQQVSDLSAQIQGVDQPPKTPDQTAAVLGLPDSNDWKRYAEEFDKAMRGLQQRANEPAKTSGPSVFRSTKGAARLTEPGNAPDNKDRERLQIAQQLAQLAPALRPFQDALADIDRQQQILTLQDAAAKGVISAEELSAAVGLVNQRFKETQSILGGGNFFDGFVQGSRKALKAWTDFTAAGLDAANQLVDGGLSNATDALGGFIAGTLTAKDAVKQFAIQALQDISRIIAKLIIMQSLNAILGLEKGGVVPGGVTDTAPVRKFAKGGIAHRPTMALFGEGKTKEAFVPLPDNRSIPVSFVGGGGGGGAVVNIHITAMDSRDVQRSLHENAGTLRQIFTNQTETKHGMRQVIKRSVA